MELCALKAIEDYQNEFRFHLPHEHRPAGRPMKTTPLTPILAAADAEFGVVNGWERAAYFKPTRDFVETHGYHFNETFDVVGAEVHAVQTAVGLTEVNGFNRFEITGPGAMDWLDRLTCSNIRKQTGKVSLAYLLNHQGNIKCEATLATLDENTVWYGSAAASEFHDKDWLDTHLPDDGSVSIRSLTNDYTILVLAGPKAREVLSAVSRNDWSPQAFPWLSVRKAFIGIAPAVVMSVSFSGELAYEIHVPNAQLYAAWLAIRQAGDPLGLTLFGSHAVDSMRLEKGYRHWKADLITEFNPFESDLSRFINMNKAEFIGKQGVETASQQVRFVTLVLDCTHAPAQGGDSMIAEGRVVGTVTSAGWGYRVGKNIAMGFVDAAFTEPGCRLQVEIIGKAVDACVVDPCLYDADYKLVRM